MAFFLKDHEYFFKISSKARAMSFSFVYPLHSQQWLVYNRH